MVRGSPIATASKRPAQCFRGSEHEDGPHHPGARGDLDRCLGEL